MANTRTNRTQKDIVVDALESGEEVTRYKMLPYGIVRLEHYIWLLRKAGMNIRGNWHTDREGKRYKAYRLAPEPLGYFPYN